MKWMVIFLTVPLYGMESPVTKHIENGSLESVHKTLTRSQNSHKDIEDLSSSSETKDKLRELVTKSLEDAQREQNSLVTPQRAKNAAIGIATGGIGLYTAIYSFISVMEEQDNHDYITPTVGFINSGFLFWCSGKELWKMIIHKAAHRKAEKAMMIQFMLDKQEAEENAIGMPLQRTRPKSDISALSQEGTTHETNESKS